MTPVVLHVYSVSEGTIHLAVSAG